MGVSPIAGTSNFTRYVQQLREHVEKLPDEIKDRSADAYVAHAEGMALGLGIIDAPTERVARTQVEASRRLAQIADAATQYNERARQVYCASAGRQIDLKA